MSENKDHMPTNTGSGTARCSCGWVSGHYSHDDDLWAAFDAHIPSSSAEVADAD